MAHFSWKAVIRLSLVTVPVRGYNTAVAGEGEVHFHQLHKTCKNRIRYKKFCPVHGEVENSEIVPGFEYAKGQYALMSRDELDKLRPEGEKQIALETFLPQDALDPLYFDGRNYFLVPDGKVAAKPYNVLFQAMEKSRVAALAQGVVLGKEELMLLRPGEGALLLSMLHHVAELRTADEIGEDWSKSDVQKEELRLAETLIQASLSEDVDLSAYKNRHFADVKRLIAAKVKGKRIAVPDQPDALPPVINILDALKQSLSARKVRGPGGPGSSRAKSRAARTASRRKRA